MGISFNNYIGKNDDISILEQKGIFTVFQMDRDLSVSPTEAAVKYYMSQMECTQHQLYISLMNNAVRLNPGAMKFLGGNVQMQTGVTGIGDLMGKMVKSHVTNNAPIKPVYRGTGFVVTEPTYKHLIILDLSKWDGAVVLDDGTFVACDDEIKDTVVARSNVSSAVFGKEGLFNCCLRGAGYAVIKSPVHRDELVEVYLDNDVFKVDGNNAIAWSDTLQFSVEKSSRSLIGSAVSGEGLVNVFRGSGRILLAP